MRQKERWRDVDGVPQAFVYMCMRFHLFLGGAALLKEAVFLRVKFDAHTHDNSLDRREGSFKVLSWTGALQEEERCWIQVPVKKKKCFTFILVVIICPTDRGQIKW